MRKDKVIKLIVAFRNSANAPEKEFYIVIGAGPSGRAV